MSHASGSLLNIEFSIEKYLWDNIAAPENELLIKQGDIATRLTELESVGHAVLWKLMGGSAGNKGELTLHVGATYFGDTGGIQRLTLVDKIKCLLDISASIEVFDYPAGVPTDKVNELTLVGPVRYWPEFIEANNFVTQLVAQKLKYAQLRA